jgi:tetratricopeptide (TPR) repeat protein
MSTAARRYYLRGRAALDAGEAEQAIDALASALDLAPAFTDARLAYALALYRLGDTPRAAQTLRAGLGHARTAAARAALSLTLGDVLTAAGDFAGAEDALKLAAAHPPLAARAASARARVLARTGRYPDALAALLAAARGI